MGYQPRPGGARVAELGHRRRRLDGSGPPRTGSGRAVWDEDRLLLGPLLVGWADLRSVSDRQAAGGERPRRRRRPTSDDPPPGRKTEARQASATSHEEEGPRVGCRQRSRTPCADSQARAPTPEPAPPPSGEPAGQEP